MNFEGEKLHVNETKMKVKNFRSRKITVRPNYD